MFVFKETHTVQCAEDFMWGMWSMQQWLSYLVNYPYEGHQIPTSTCAIAHCNGATHMYDQPPFVWVYWTAGLVLQLSSELQQYSHSSSE